MEEPNGWMISVGNIRDGFTFYGPFETHEDALETAENKYDEWNIIPFFKAT